MSDDFDLAHDKLPDQPMTIGGDKSAAAWHPGNGPEVPYADLISRLDWYKAKLERVRQGVNSPSTIAAVEADVLFYEGILAALGDTVSRAEYRQANTDWRNGMLHVEAERDALAHVIEQAKRVRQPDPGQDWYAYAVEVQSALQTAPVVSLTLHDAEVKAQGKASALRQVSNAVRDPDKLMGLSPHALADALWAEAEKHDPVENARARTAAIREAAN